MVKTPREKGIAGSSPAESTWYYIYYRSGRDVMYDRTMPRCDLGGRTVPETWAEERVNELRQRGKEAWCTTDVLRHAFY